MVVKCRAVGMPDYRRTGSVGHCAVRQSYLSRRSTYTVVDETLSTKLEGQAGGTLQRRRTSNRHSTILFEMGGRAM